MPNLPAFRRTRRTPGTGVRLVPLQDLNDVQWMLLSILALQLLILLGVLFRG